MSPPPLPPEPLLGRLNVLLGIGAALWLGILFLSDSATEAGLPHCLFHRLTGFHCPGCGSTRAIHSLLHGQLLPALRFNPLMVLSLPLLGLLAVERMGRAGWLPAGAQVLVSKKITTPLPWVVIAYFILRNVPFFPFTLLAPASA